MLQEYRKKRSFDKTPEPTGGKASGEQLVFVVQKHDASRLHYDFRLEMNGVLKSWAIPKGPSLNPADKRLAMMVEDHPYNYRDFEGIIPEGNYGAGTVIVWDEGTYEPLEPAKSKAEAEKILQKALKTGSLKIRMHGKKLKGEFALVHIHGREENAWLLIKHKDEFAATKDITKADRSVVSGKTLHQVETDKKARQWTSKGHDHQTAPAGSKPKKTSEAGKAVTPTPPEPVAGKKASAGKKSTPAFAAVAGKKAPRPAHVKPMLATMVEEPFDGKDWLYEIKWDGYRAVADLRKGKVALDSRNNISFNEKFAVVRDALAALDINAVLDGEVVALNEDGTASFQLLQNYLKQGKETNLVYYVFDILWYEGRDLTQLPLVERKQLLESILPADNDVIRYSGHIVEKGRAFFAAALKKGLEGVMAKQCDSLYAMDTRSRSWLKIKNNRQMEVIIGGFTKGRESRKYFGAVILGKYEGKTLRYVGHSGSGFDQQGLKDLYARLQPLITEKCPFEPRPKTNMPATWVRPELVCVVKFTEVTDEGSLRHPIFMGLREDKRGNEEKDVKVVKAPLDREAKRKKAAPPGRRSKKIPVKVERMVRATVKLLKAGTQKEGPGTKAVKSGPEKGGSGGKALKTVPLKEKVGKETTGKRTKTKETTKDSKTKDITGSLIGPEEKEKEVQVAGRSLTLTNAQKLYWKKEKISKGDLLNYYHSVAEYILPYLVDRPQSMNRYPDGIEGMHFYNKNVGEHTPSWIKTLVYAAGDEGKETKYLVAKDEASLLYMANLGCIEMNPWHSRAGKPEKPDWCVIDLDPDTSNTFQQVMEAARITRDLLESAGVKSYCKTSGSTGMHIYIPLGAAYSYDQSKMLAELVVGLVHEQIPGYTSLERSPAKRKGKMYLDFLQNRATQTIAAPYSLRPKPGATVSMPLHWEELRPSLAISDFTIHNALDRIRHEGDIFQPVLGKGIDLRKVLEKFQGLR